MTPWERAWLYVTSFIAGLALVVACAAVVNAQAIAPDVALQYGQIVFEARNRCEGELARVKAELASTRSLLDDLKAKQTPKPEERK